MAVAITELLAEIDRLLEPSGFEDYCVNGLQVPGPRQVDRIATGVSAHAELFELAAAEGVDLLIVHHGLFWGGGTAAVGPVLKRRLQILFDADIALAAYHLPLDAHPGLGNNALLASLLGGVELTPFAVHRGRAIGFLAVLPGSGLTVQELIARAGEVTAREPLAFEAGVERVRRIAVVSGAGGDHLEEAAAAGADALMTGEVEERTMALARELGMNVIAAGHYATETFGVRRLGEHLADRFGLDHVFLDVPNPV
ncbi:MAG TPA: Nif3-like dinuclear metal center hexameric protein [Solirubrobacteraceae bacterium]|nr:Nif3-like dinuclear metal center hexameric protein [Solirubrobacteraceae bacterium]